LWKRIEAVELTVDHKPEDSVERARIESSGGVVAQQEYDPGEFEGPFRAGAYTRPLFSSTRAVSVTKHTLNTP
jgi:hypothetical protein